MSSIDRASRWIVLVSMLGATALEAFLVRRNWALLPELTAATFLLGVGLGRWFPQLALGLALAVGALVPAAFGLGRGSYWLGHSVVWMAAVLGVVAIGTPTSGWAFPSRWKAPLALWALVIALSWPVVLLRETDFRLGMLEALRVANTHIGVPPSGVAISLLDGALTGGIGLLWIDALFRVFGRSPLSEITRWLLVPAGVSIAFACLVATYQGFVDVTVLNRTHFGLESRAVGTMSDANAFGSLAGMWTSGLAALALLRFNHRHAWVAALGAALALSAVWWSGSRTALLGAVIGLAFVLGSLFLAVSGRTRVWLGVTAGASVLVLMAAMMVFDPGGVGPLGRSMSQIPDLQTEGVFAVARELLWDRNNHGASAVMMIREYPLVGIGVGTFNLLVVDYCRVLGGWVVFDNAQNWLRHQLAELGVVGSIGLIFWCGLFAATLLRSRAAVPHRVAASGVKGALLGLAAASLLGMPAQNTLVSLTFWTFAFWYLAIAVPAERQAASVWPWRTAAAWPLVAVLAVAHVMMTFSIGQGALRPASRAARFGWPYSYGFYALERGPEGEGFRWSGREAVSVVEATGGVLQLKAWVYHPDVSQQPVHVRVWVDSQLALDAELQSALPVMRDITVPADAARVVVRTWVDRVWRPSDHGSTDNRELGVALADWKFSHPSAPLSMASPAAVTAR